MYGGFPTIVQVTLGSISTISPSSNGICTDGDGTSLTLLTGVIRTEVCQAGYSLVNVIP